MMKFSIWDPPPKKKIKHLQIIWVSCNLLSIFDTFISWIHPMDFISTQLYQVLRKLFICRQLINLFEMKLCSFHCVNWLLLDQLEITLRWIEVFFYHLILYKLIDNNENINDRNDLSKVSIKMQQQDILFGGWELNINSDIICIFSFYFWTDHKILQFLNKYKI